MSSFDPTQLSDDELREAFAAIKPSPIFDAFFIGFLVGIILYGVFVNAWGVALLIPLWLIRVFLRKSKKYDALKEELKQRGLDVQHD